ncbi:hypothetical protein EVAR_31247_1 [Eumeta japonica]|uniref:Uncharacterized protein n=1 Tax=Eumeta variegata TaxID=151549 RepID=A0A4C1W1C2_EUMVA|nr:hypothetical protein EVAR_31247_1 [Eumeta japonica]
MKVITEAAKIWKFGQICGLTCLTFEDEPRANRFLLIPVITSVAVAQRNQSSSRESQVVQSRQPNGSLVTLRYFDDNNRTNTQPGRS